MGDHRSVKNLLRTALKVQTKSMVLLFTCFRSNEKKYHYSMELQSSKKVQYMHLHMSSSLAQGQKNAKLCFPPMSIPSILPLSIACFEFPLIHCCITICSFPLIRWTDELCLMVQGCFNEIHHSPGCHFQLQIRVTMLLYQLFLVRGIKQQWGFVLLSFLTLQHNRPWIINMHASKLDKLFNWILEQISCS